jgi:hypothetical protein
MHYPGSDILLPVGLMFLSIVSILLIFESNPQEKFVDEIDFKMLTIYKHFLGWGSAIFSIGGLFYVQHYPGGQIMSSVGIIIGLCSLLLTIYITFFKRISLLYVSKLISITMLTFFIWGASGYFMRISKSFLHSFVELHDNVTLELENELEFGNLEIERFKNSKKGKNFENDLNYINQIDKLTAEQIKYLDALKMELLSELKEDPAMMKPGDRFSIITAPYDDKYPLRPIKMNIQNIMNKDKFDEVMRIFGLTGIVSHPVSYKCKSSGAAAGINLWNNMLEYRGELCSLLVASVSNDSAKCTFVDPKIVKYSDYTDLKNNVGSAFKNCSINSVDYQNVENIYISLTKNEFWQFENNPGVSYHWLAKTFDHAPAISALSSISMLQKEVLSARRMAISSIVNRQ